MTEGVIVVAGARVLLINPRAREIFDFWGPARDLRVLEFVRSLEIHEALTAASERGTPTVREVILDRGERRTLLMHAQAFPLGEGRGGAVAVFHDVTELRRMEAVRRDFIANASHDLRTPLTSIRGFADALLAESVSPSDRRRYLGIISRNAQRLNELIDDLLELSRIEGRSEALELREISIREIAAQVVSDLTPRLEAAKLTIKCAFEDAGMAWGDPGAVLRVLTNLLDNAIKYSDPGGSIGIRVWREQGFIWTRLTDTGVGIAEAELSRIFERFYRADKARSRSRGGTGLGLSIVKLLVQAMAGEVSVTSQLGVGSQFTVRLPAADNA
jgi:two-component system phosphate regulon sensor histidine kinase PhoR